jgi:hypothetical protein
VDPVFDQIHQYDLYRYGFGVAVASLSLIVVVLILLGLGLGVVGWKPKKQPFDRTAVSHCGGRFLLIAVGVAFVFGCLVMVMSAVGFFFGSNAQKVCQSLEGPQYEAFENVVDNQELWGGSVLGAVVFRDPRETLSLSQLLRNCENDYALYKAMNLSFLFDIRNDIINFTEVTESLAGEILAAAGSVQLSSDNFFSSDALRGLTDLSRHFSSLNIQSLEEDLSSSRPAVGFNAGEVVGSLSVYRDSTGNATTRDQVDQLISEIQAVSTLAGEIDNLTATLLQDAMALNAAVTTTAALVEQATAIIAYISGDGLALVLNNTSTETFTEIAGYIDGFIEYLADGVRLGNNTICLALP